MQCEVAGRCCGAEKQLNGIAVQREAAGSQCSAERSSRKLMQCREKQLEANAVQREAAES